MNSLNEKLFLLTGTEYASAYHPQTNGLDERMNQTVTKSLVKYINADQNDCDENSESVLFSYRTSVHATTKNTPFYNCTHACSATEYTWNTKKEGSSVIDEVCACAVHT